MSPFVLLGLLAAAPRQLQAQEVQPAQATISAQLAAELAATDGPVDALVILRDQPDVAALAHSADLAAVIASPTQPAAQRVARVDHVYRGLTDHAARSQTDLRAWLAAKGVPYRPFYVANMIQVRADAALVQELAARPDVDRIVGNPRVNLSHAPPAAPAWAQARATAGPMSVVVPYGVTATGAPTVWEQGFRGQGIVLASQDTGVAWDHPALQATYLGWDGSAANHTYAWHDAWANSPGFDPCATAAPGAPCDDNGHGTHTVGTMLGQAGDEVYGMAPDARWMGCRNMLSGVGTPASYTACFEFFLAPYPQDGDSFLDGRPDLAPHIINNSWACPPSEGCDADSLRQVVEAVRAAGLLVVASAGNSGPGCATVQDPIAIYDATFSVGAHAADGGLASFSSRGPVAVDGSSRPKPDLTAPGVGVYAPYLNGSYATLSGTSMAAPHVAGAAALLWSAAPYLVGDPDLTEQALLKSAAPVLDGACSPSGEPTSPNLAYGYGRLDVAAAVALAQQPWQVAVEVTTVGGAPVEGAAVTWEDDRTGYRYTDFTQFGGVARLDPLLPGAYTVRGQAPGGVGAAFAVELPYGALTSQTGEFADGGLVLRYQAQPHPTITRPHTYYFPVFWRDN